MLRCYRAEFALFVKEPREGQSLFFSNVGIGAVGGGGIVVDAPQFKETDIAETILIAHALVQKSG